MGLLITPPTTPDYPTFFTPHAWGITHSFLVRLLFLVDVAVAYLCASAPLCRECPSFVKLTCQVLGTTAIEWSRPLSYVSYIFGIQKL